MDKYIRVKNCNCISDATIEIVEKSLNIKYGSNGTGKSTISEAIYAQANNETDRLKDLKPYGSDDNSQPTVDNPYFHVVKVFNEDYVNSYLFQGDEFLDDSFQVFLKSDKCDSLAAQIERMLEELQDLINNIDAIHNLRTFLPQYTAAVKASDGTVSRRGGVAEFVNGNGGGFNHYSELKAYKPFYSRDLPSVAKWAKWRNDGIKQKIFNSIDKIKGMRSIIKESYISLKNRIGRTPLLFDFYEQGEIDPLVIIREYKTYWQFLEAVEKGKYFSKLTDHEKLILDYLSKTILSGVRPSELFLLQKLLTKKTFSVNEVQKELKRLLDYNITDLEMRESVKILQGCFTSKDEEYQKYNTIEIMDYDEKQGVRCFASYANCLLDNEFNTQVKDIINVGLARYRDKYAHGKVEQTPFVLYEKYSRRDVSLLMNCGKDMSSTMYGMSRIGDDVFIFITYHKEEAEEGKNYADGKPDYADAFEDNLIFKWDSQIGKDNSSPYMQKVLTAPRKHLLVKKSDAESSFYYMGQFDIIESVDSQKEDNSGKMKPIAKVTMKMHHPVREDLLRYLQSNISKENKAV